MNVEAFINLQGGFSYHHSTFRTAKLRIYFYYTSGNGLIFRKNFKSGQWKVVSGQSKNMKYEVWSMKLQIEI